MKKEFILEGLTCSNCASKIEQALNKVEYVSNASQSYNNNIKTVWSVGYKFSNEKRN